MYSSKIKPHSATSGKLALLLCSAFCLHKNYKQDALKASRSSHNITCKLNITSENLPCLIRPLCLLAQPRWYQKLLWVLAHPNREMNAEHLLAEKKTRKYGTLHAFRKTDTIISNMTKPGSICTILLCIASKLKKMKTSCSFIIMQAGVDPNQV